MASGEVWKHQMLNLSIEGAKGLSNILILCNLKASFSVTARKPL